MNRYCVSCGTEVDESAVFCPTCGQPIDERAEAPPAVAPSWPDPAAVDLPDEEDAAGEADETEESAPPPVPITPDAPTRVEERPREVRSAAPPPTSGPAPQDAARGPSGTPQRRASTSLNLPFTRPVTLSAWLIGAGTLMAALGLVVILVVSVLNVIDLLLVVAMVGIAATVFLAAHLPSLPNVRLVTLVIVLISFGVALDRIGIRGGGVGELLFFLGTAAATIGAIILELGHDQPVGGDA